MLTTFEHHRIATLTGLFTERSGGKSQTEDSKVRSMLNCDQLSLVDFLW